MTLSHLCLLSFSSVFLQQLRANVTEMEKLCLRVRAEDMDALEMLVKPVRDKASAAAQNFLLLHSNPVPQPTPATSPAAQPSHFMSDISHVDGEAGEEPAPHRQIQLQLPEIPVDQSAAESWDNLEQVFITCYINTQPQLSFNNLWFIILHV